MPIDPSINIVADTIVSYYPPEENRIRVRIVSVMLGKENYRSAVHYPDRMVVIYDYGGWDLLTTIYRDYYLVSLPIVKPIVYNRLSFL